MPYQEVQGSPNPDSPNSGRVKWNANDAELYDLIDAHESLSTAAHGGIVPSARLISTAARLTGGGNLTANRTLDLAPTGVSAGTYANMTGTVNQYGQLTSVVAGETLEYTGAKTIRDYGATGVATTTKGAVSLTVTSTTGPDKVTVEDLAGLSVGERIWIRAAKLGGTNNDQYVPLVATITAIDGLVITHDGTADRAVSIPGTGETDNVAHDATKAIQDSINAEAVTIIPPGVYRISSKITVPFNRTIVGYGYASRIVSQNDPRNNHWGFRTDTETGGGGRIRLQDVWMEGDWNEKTPKDFVSSGVYALGDMVKPTNVDPTTAKTMHIYEVTSVTDDATAAASEPPRHYQTETQHFLNVRTIASDTTDANKGTRRVFTLTAISGSLAKTDTSATEPNWASVAAGGTITETNAAGTILTWTESGSIGQYWRTGSAETVTSGSVVFTEYSPAAESRAMNFRTNVPQTPSAHVYEVFISGCTVTKWNGVTYRMEGIDRLQMIGNIAYKNTRGGLIAAKAGLDTVITGNLALELGDDCIAVNANTSTTNQARHERFTVTGNVCSTRADAEYGAGVITRGGAEGTITGNTIYRAKNAGVSIVDYFGSVPRNILVSSNTIREGTDGVELKSDTATGITMVNNIISAVKSNGIIWKRDGTTAVDIQDIFIDGNSIRFTPALSTDVAGDGIIISGNAGDVGSNITVTNNRVRQAARSGICVGALPASNAAKIRITNLNVANNQVSDSARLTNAVPQIQVQNALKVRIANNFVTEQRGTSLVSDGIRIGTDCQTGSYLGNFSLNVATISGANGIFVVSGLTNVTDQGGNKV